MLEHTALLCASSVPAARSAQAAADGQASDEQFQPSYPPQHSHCPFVLHSPWLEHWWWHCPSTTRTVLAARRPDTSNNAFLILRIRRAVPPGGGAGRGPLVVSPRREQSRSRATPHNEAKHRLAYFAGCNWCLCVWPSHASSVQGSKEEDGGKDSRADRYVRTWYLL